MEKFLFYFTPQYFDEERLTSGPLKDGWISSASHNQTCTEAEAAFAAAAMLKERNDLDPSYGGLLAVKKSRNRIRVRKVIAYEDSFV